MGTAAPEGTADMLMSRRSAVRARLANEAGVSVHYINASGDCFYEAVEQARKDAGDLTATVELQRSLVASGLTEETFTLYRLLYDQEAEGFQWMKGVNTLEQLRNQIRKTGYKVGAGKCVWADGFAMETIATHFGMMLLVVDERLTGAQKFTRIMPKNGPSPHAIILHGSCREHFNLVSFDGDKFPQVCQLPDSIKQLFRLPIKNADGADGSGSGDLAQSKDAKDSMTSTSKCAGGETGKRGAGRGASARGASGRGRGSTAQEQQQAPTSPPPEDRSASKRPIKATKATKAADTLPKRPAENPPQIAVASKRTRLPGSRLAKRTGKTVAEEVAEEESAQELSKSNSSLPTVSELVGREVDVPSKVFHNNTDGTYRGIVRKATSGRRAAVDVTFQSDGSKYWFPISELAHQSV